MQLWLFCFASIWVSKQIVKDPVFPGFHCWLWVVYSPEPLCVWHTLWAYRDIRSHEPNSSGISNVTKPLWNHTVCYGASLRDWASIYFSSSQMWDSSWNYFSIHWFSKIFKHTYTHQFCSSWKPWLIIFIMSSSYNVCKLNTIKLWFIILSQK